jgi:regulator of chromosome condensation
VLTTDGRVFTFGCNDEGALGRKGTECIPIMVAMEDPIDLIAAGDNHSLFANSLNGAIYFTGNYNYKRGEKMKETSAMEPIRIYAH